MPNESSQHQDIIAAVKESPQSINQRFVSGGGTERLTPLQYAVVMDDADLVRKLIELGADIEEPDAFRSTPLMMAAYNKRQSISEFLVQHGADLTAVNSVGKTVLHHAAQHGDIGLVKRVLAAGVSVNAADGEGYTPLHCAVINDQMEAIQTLIRNGANPLIKTSPSSKAGASKTARDFAASFSKRSLELLATQTTAPKRQWWEFWK